MSFIYDDKRLVQSLIDAAEKHVEKFGQRRPQQGGAAPIEQQWPGDRPEVIPTYEIAQKLLYRLQRDLGDQDAPSAGAPIGVEGMDPSQPGANLPTALPKDLRTLGDFLQWAAKNKITWQGKRFAWTPEEVQANRDKPEDPTQKAWEFTSYRTDRNDRRVDRTPATVPAYADKAGLIAYLSFLRDSPDAQNNKVLAFMLATLIGEANSYLRVAGEQTIDPRHKPGAQADINPETVVDVIPDPMELDKWNAGIDEHPFQTNTNTLQQLRVKHLTDAGAFQAWFRNRNVKVVTPAGKNQPAKSTVMGATASDGDPCLAIHILYKRAAYLKQVAAGDDGTVTNYSKAVALYLQQITTFGRNYQKDGKPCAVTQPGTQGEQPGQQPGQQQGGGGKVDPQQLNSIIMLMPLLARSVDFNRIIQFFNEYARVVPDSQITAMQTEAVGAINEINQRLLAHPVPGWDLYAGPQTVATSLTNAPQQYDSFVGNLRKVVDETEKAINAFYNAYIIPRDPVSGRSAFSSQQEAFVANQLRIARDNKMRIDNIGDQRSQVIQTNYRPHSGR